MALPNSTYSRHVAKTDSYTLTVKDDVANFTITSAKNATLPLAGACTAQNQANVKQVINNVNSTNTLTILVQSGNTLLGIGSLAAGQIANVVSDGSSTWTSYGGGGQAGSSGYSGPSGFSGFTGISGYSGFTGISGYSGFTGVSGYSGYTGTSGASGFSGFSGISGYSGYSGKSGYSGFSG